MTAFLRTIEFLVLSLWLGGDAFVSLMFAPGAFQILASRDQAGAMVGYALHRVHFGGIICGVVLLLVRLARTRTFASLIAPTALCVVLMIILTVVSQQVVSPKMAVLQTQMGSIQATAADSPLLAEFNRWHRVSVRLEGGVLLAGTLAIYLMTRELVLAH